MQDYDIRFDDLANKIKEIRHRQFGLVKYTSVKIDEECGYVSGSRLTVYTSVYNQNDEMLNIVHIHLNDMSEQVTIECTYMEDGQIPNEFKTFKTDVTG